MPFSRRAVICGLAFCAGPALARQPAKAPPPTAQPAISAPRSLMAGAPATALISRVPADARLAIARVTDPDDRAIVVAPAGTAASVSLPSPGVAGSWEIRLLRDIDGRPAVLLRQPLVTTAPEATLAAPARIARGSTLPVRGIGPNGERDRVVLVRPDAPADADGPYFFPAENVESTLDAPEEPGLYELRYVMVAPVSGRIVLARRAVAVD